jgi:hypothetical protein
MLIMSITTSIIITVRAVPSTANPWMVQSGHRHLADAVPPTMTSANASMMSLRVQAKCSIEQDHPIVVTSKSEDNIGPCRILTPMPSSVVRSSP